MTARDFLAFSVSEQEQRQAENLRRQPVRRALERAALGEGLSLFDISRGVPQFASEYTKALKEIEDEQTRQRRAAAALLALERLRGVPR